MITAAMATIATVETARITSLFLSCHLHGTQPAGETLAHGRPDEAMPAFAAV
jgi:hypothetical protein